MDQLGLEHGLDLRYDKTSVTRWLRGQQPRGTTPALIAEVFTRRLGRRLSAQDLGLDACAPVYAGLEFAATPEEAVDIVSGLWRKDSGSHAELRKIAFTPAGLVVPSRDWLIGRADERVAPRRDPRRPARPGCPPQGRARRCPGSAGTDRARARASGSPPATSRRCARSASCSAPWTTPYGGGHARQALVRYLEHEAEPMLRGTYGETTGRRLFARRRRPDPAGGLDVVRHRRARPRPALLRPGAAARPGGRGPGVRGVRAGHDEPAGRLPGARPGGGAARPGRPAGRRHGSAPPVVQALLHSAEARGHGVLGEVRACTASLARAERALEAARPGDDVPHWARFFDEAQLADEFGHCHRDLQQYRAAAQHAERSLQLRAPAYARSRLFCRVVLATARLGLGELDQACALGAEAARQAAEMRSVRAVEYVRDFERRLEPYRDAAAVRSYRDTGRPRWA